MKKRNNLIIPLLFILILLPSLFRGNFYLLMWNREYRQSPTWGADFCSYYYYGFYFRKGCFHIYDEKTMAQYGEVIKPDVETKYPPNYPPFLFLMHVPFTWLPSLMAKQINFILNHIWLFLSILFIHMIFLEKRGGRNTFLLTLFSFVPLLTFSPVIDNLVSGQINIFLTFLLTLFIFFYMRKRYLPAAFFLAIAINIKLFPLFIILYFIVKREWRNTATTLFISLALNLPFLFLCNPAKLFSEFSSRVSRLGLYAEPSFTIQSLPELIIRVLHTPLPLSTVIALKKITFVIVTLVIVVMMGYFGRRRQSSAVYDRLFLLTLTFNIYFIGFYYVFPIHHVMIIIFYLILLNYFIDLRYEATGFQVLSLALFGLTSYFDGEASFDRADFVMRYFLLLSNLGFILILLAFFLNIKALAEVTQEPSPEYKREEDAEGVSSNGREERRDAENKPDSH